MSPSTLRIEIANILVYSAASVVFGIIKAVHIDVSLKSSSCGRAAGLVDLVATPERARLALAFHRFQFCRA